MSAAKKFTKITNCPHKDKTHYAKGMCCVCYRKINIGKLASKCEHKDKAQYCKGKCKECYMQDYFQFSTKNKRKIKQSLKN